MGSTPMVERERERERDGENRGRLTTMIVVVNEGGFALRALAIELCAFESERSKELHWREKRTERHD